MSWLSRLVNALRPSALDRDLDDEIKFHLARRTDDLVAAGMPREQAESMARRQFGDPLRLREASHDVKAAMSLEDIVRDVRHGIRALRRTPVFAGAAILTLALGIGANAAIFSLVSGVLLRPLAYPQPEQLMHLSTTAGGEQAPVSVPEYLEFQRFNQSFAHVGAFRTGEANLATGERAVSVRSVFADAPLLQALGVSIVQGRLFGPSDSVVTAAPLPGGSAATQPVMLISSELAQSLFGEASVVGRTLDVDGRPVEVVGVLAPATDLMDAHPDIWLPLGFTNEELQARNNHNLFLIGRLKDAATAASAQTEQTALIESWGARAGITPGAGHAGHLLVPPSNDSSGHTLQITPLANQILGRTGRSIWILQAAVGLVLLIACANVASLLLARGTMRRREFAMMAALGAGWHRLLRKAIVESVILSVAGGAIGVAVARAGVDVLVRTHPASLPRIGEVTVDHRVLLASLAAALCCGVLFGLAPVLDRRWNTVADALKSNGRGIGGIPRNRARRALIVAETALAVIVAVAAGLLLRTVHGLTAVDPGFNRARLTTFSITLPRARFDYLGRVRAYQAVVEKLRGVPGVDGVSAMTGLPLDRQYLGNLTEIAYSSTGGSPVAIDYQRVMTGFFETMGIPITEGRGFDSADAAPEGMVAVVNETLAQAHWKGRSPIGQRLRPADTGPWFTVIGVARDVKQAGVDQPVGPEAYVLVDQLTAPPRSWVAISPTSMHIVVRSIVPLETLAPTMRQVVHDVAPDVPVARLRAMDDVFKQSIRRPRLLAQLLTLFSAIALVLAAIGTYGTLAFTVAERRRELGIRLALGAERRRLLRDVMAQGLTPAGIGVLCGLAGAVGMSGVLSSLLFGVKPVDLLTLSTAVLTILLTAAGASWLPAWRASRLDPSLVLRGE